MTNSSAENSSAENSSAETSETWPLEGRLVSRVPYLSLG